MLHYVNAHTGPSPAFRHNNKLLNFQGENHSIDKKDARIISQCFFLMRVVNDGEKVRLQSELNRLKNKQSEAETRSNVVQSRLKELQTDLSSTRKKLETTQSNNKDLRQQVMTASKN